MSKKPDYSDEWPEITKETPLEEVQRIHKKIWQYVVDHGEKPATPYTSDCVLCEFTTIRYRGTGCFYCPAKSKQSTTICHIANGGIGEYEKWANNGDIESAIAVRDIPFKTMEEINNAV